MKASFVLVCLLSSLSACADPDQDPEALESAALAARADGPWLDDDGDPDGGERGSPWLDPPEAPARPGAHASGYRFEVDAQGWSRSGPPITSVIRSTVQRASGTGSLAVQIDGAGTAQASVANPPVRAGATVSFRIYLQSTANLAWIQPYVQQGASANWAWTGTWQDAARLRVGAWNTLTVTVPSNATSVAALGVQVATAGTVHTRIYVDDVTF